MDRNMSINWTEWSTIPACPSFVCFFNKGSIEETNNYPKLCVWYLCMRVLFYICLGTESVDLTRGRVCVIIIRERVLKCAFAISDGVRTS